MVRAIVAFEISGFVYQRAELSEDPGLESHFLLYSFEVTSLDNSIFPDDSATPLGFLSRVHCHG